MAHRVLLIRLAWLAGIALLAACGTEATLPPDDGPVIAAGNFAGAIISADYDEAFSYLTTSTQATLGEPAALEARFGDLCPGEYARYEVQMRPTEGEGIVVNTGTLTCADGSGVSVLIVTENTGPQVWLVRDFQVNLAGSDG